MTEIAITIASKDTCLICTNDFSSLESKCSKCEGCKICDKCTALYEKNIRNNNVPNTCPICRDTNWKVIKSPRPSPRNLVHPENSTPSNTTSSARTATSTRRNIRSRTSNNTGINNTYKRVMCFVAAGVFFAFIAGHIVMGISMALGQRSEYEFEYAMIFGFALMAFYLALFLGMLFICETASCMEKYIRKCCC